MTMTDNHAAAVHSSANAEGAETQPSMLVIKRHQTWDSGTCWQMLK
jgi:hypothetical protein